MAIKEAMGVSLYDMDDVDQFHEIAGVEVTGSVDVDEDSLLKRIENVAPKVVLNPPSEADVKMIEDMNELDYEVEGEQG